MNIKTFPFTVMDFSKFGDIAHGSLIDRYWIKRMLESGAEWDICEWCGATVPIYFPDARYGRTTCKSCGRNCGGWGQLYREEYKDGCYHVVYDDGGDEWTGGRHAPHNKFVKDSPIRVLHPIIKRKPNSYYLDKDKCKG